MSAADACCANTCSEMTENLELPAAWRRCGFRTLMGIVFSRTGTLTLSVRLAYADAIAEVVQRN